MLPVFLCLRGLEGFSCVELFGVSCYNAFSSLRFLCKGETMMKRIIALILAAVLVCSMLAGCGSKSAGSEQENTEAVQPEAESGTEETPSEAVSNADFDLASIETLGQLFAYPSLGTAAYGDKYIYAFERDGIVYRAVAAIPEEVADQVFTLDVNDPAYEQTVNELTAPLPVVSITDLNAGVPTPEELEPLVGKSGSDLLEQGWHLWGWNLDKMEFLMLHGPYGFQVVFSGQVDNRDDFDEDDLKPLTVESVTYNGIDDPTSMDD